MRYFLSSIFALVAVAAQAQQPAFVVKPGFIVVQPPAPKPAPSLWKKCANGWLQSSISGHYDHPFWGHKDKDFDWASWYPTQADLDECAAFMADAGLSYEVPNQHYIAHMQQSAWQLKQKQTYQPATYAAPAYYAPMQWSGGGMMKGRLFKGRGGSCGAGG